MNAAILLGLVRHIVTVLGTLLAGKGYIGESDIELYVGAAVAIAAGGWSAWQKIQANRAAAAAVMKVALVGFFLAPLLGACAAPISGNLKADISATVAKDDGPSDRIITGLQNASWNLNEAVRVGALLPDDPAPACLKRTLVDLGIDPDAQPAEPPPSFTPRTEGLLDRAAVVYIRARQLERATEGPAFKLSFECKALVGQIVIDAGRAARRVGSNIIPGGGVISRVLD